MPITSNCVIQQHGLHNVLTSFVASLIHDRTAFYTNPRSYSLAKTTYTDRRSTNGLVTPFLDVRSRTEAQSGKTIMSQCYGDVEVDPPVVCRNQSWYLWNMSDGLLLELTVGAAVAQ
jgi:hypothetical protein